MRTLLDMNSNAKNTDQCSAFRSGIAAYLEVVGGDDDAIVVAVDLHREHRTAVGMPMHVVEVLEVARILAAAQEVVVMALNRGPT